MPIEKSDISPFFVISLMFLSVLSPIAGFTAAGAGQGIITTFADGNNSMSLMLNGGSTNSDSVLALERNSTVNNAVFEISYSTMSSSPGDVTLDIGNDSQYEWAWDTQGYGNLGAQTEFSNGLSSTNGSVNSSGNIIGDILLPSQGQIQYAEMYAEFAPDYGGGFAATGVIDSLTVGDTDGDGLPEPVFLQRSHTWANGTVSPAVGTFDWSSANGFSAITWSSICDGAGELVVADFNDDGLADVASFDITNDTACMLFTQTNGSWGANTNQSLGMGASGIDSGDMDGDGDYELISIHSNGNLREFVFNTQNGSFGLGAVATVSANGTGMQATLGALAVGKFWGSGNDTVVVADSMDGHVTMWNVSQGNWVVGIPGSSFDCIKSGMTTLDWNGDGLLDVLGNTDMGVCTATFNGTGWSTNETSAIQLNNYSIGDWSGNGSSDIIQSLEGNPDGNDATPTGYLQVIPFGVNGTIGNTSRTIFPHTAPKHVLLADMDGDGLSEHLVAAGESTKGLFIAGWHTVSLDFDMDNNAEGDLIGYAGDGQSGVDKLNWTDMGNISFSLAQTFSQMPFQDNLYGTPITIIRPMGVSIGDGIVSLSQMNITYDVTFTVDSNPSSGNLTNLLNSMMVPGTGTFNVTLPIDSTSSGYLTLESVVIEWVAGMTNQVFRDAPIIQNQIVFWDSAESEHIVALFWDDSAINEMDFLSYQLFRWESGTTPNLNTPYQNGIMQNMTFDNASLSGKSWDFVVRTVYQNGVYSNYSNVEHVIVPPAQSADLTAPEAVAFVNATDVGSDEGGAIIVEWPISNSSDIGWYALYEDTSPFSTISGQNEIANFTVYDNVISHIYNTTADGVEHYFGVVVGDLAGNVNWTVTSSAPAFSQNNSVRTSTVSLLVETDGVSIPVEAIAGNPLAISGQITSMGEAVAAADYSIVLTPTVQFSSITIEGVTDANGNFNHQWNDWLDFESQYTALRGDITVEIMFNGGVWGVDSQELTGSSTSDSFTAKTAATLSLTPSILQLDSEGQGVVSVSLIADNAIEQSLLTGIAIEYHIGNESNQATGDSGSVPINNNGLADVSITYPIGGEIDVNLLTQHAWLVLSNGDVRTTLLPPPESNEPDENETEEITELTPLIWSCDDIALEITVNASSVTNVCTIENPNSNLVHVDVLITSLSGLEINVIPTSASMFSNSSKDIQITLSAPLGMTADNYSIDVEITVNAAGYNQSTLTESLIVSVLAEQVIVGGNGGTQNNQDDNNPSSSGMSTGMIGGIIAIIIAIMLGGFIVLRKLTANEDEEDDLFDEYDEYDGYADDDEDEDEQPPSKKRSKPKVLHTPAKMREKPQEWAMDESGLPYTGSKAGTRPSTRKQKPKPVQMSSNESIESEEQYEEEYYDDYQEDDYTQSEDYKVDEDGVEWWKDEIGVWWYRYPDEEEWSEFIE